MTHPTIFDVDTSDAHRWSRWDRKFQPAAAEKATEAPPGSAGKVRVMLRRINSGQDLWHPLDYADGRYEG